MPTYLHTLLCIIECHPPSQVSRHRWGTCGAAARRRLYLVLVFSFFFRYIFSLNRSGVQRRPPPNPKRSCRTPPLTASYTLPEWKIPFSQIKGVRPSNYAKAKQQNKAVASSPRSPLDHLAVTTPARGVCLNLGGVGVGAQALTTDASDDVHEPSVVLHALLRPGTHKNKKQTIEDGEESHETSQQTRGPPKTCLLIKNHTQTLF